MRKSVFCIALMLFYGLIIKPNAWLYQIQEANPEEIKKMPWKLVVLDYSKDGTNEGKYSKKEITGIPATTLCYISIGEAENYRFYWGKNPSDVKNDPQEDCPEKDPAKRNLIEQKWVKKENSNQFTKEAPWWLGKTNPDWVGNYKVRYWACSWFENYLKPYFDMILQQGFDGAYLDIIDAYEYWADKDTYGKNRETRLVDDPYGDEKEAAKRMIMLVKDIANYCRKESPYKNPDFKIFPQNGEAILEYDIDGSYLKTVSGIGAEDVFYNAESETKIVRSEDTNERTKYLDQFVKNGKMVLAVDYVDRVNEGFQGTNRARIVNFVNKCRQKKYWYYAARSDRALDTMNAIRSIQPQ